MGNLTMSRRTFSKLMGATAVAAAAGMSVGGQTGLAEETEAQAAAAEEGVQKIRSCCRGCGKSECGVWVYVKDGRVIRTEGDDSCYNTMGSHCSKGQASIQACYHPDRIKYPMKRTNPKGSEDPGWVRISWEEAYQTIADNIIQIREKYGPESLFSWCGTGRQWCMQSDAGMALELFGSPNIIAAYQVCKGPRHFASRLDNVQAWSWSEVIEHPRRYVQWATDQSISNYDDSARLVVDVARTAETYISVDPRVSNLGRTAKYWLNLRPGTDNALALGWCHIILEHDLVDWKFIKRWSNAPFIVVPDMDPTGYTEAVQNGGNPWELKTRLLTEADIDPSMVDWEVEGDGNPKRYLVWDTINERWTYWQADPEDAHWEGETWAPQTEGVEEDVSRLREDGSKVAGWIANLSDFNPAIDPAVYGEFEVTLKDGSTHTGRPVWDIWAAYLEQFTPERTSEITGVDAGLIEQACLELGYARQPRHPQQRHQLRPGHRARRQLHAELPCHHGGLRDGGRHRHPRRPARRHERLDDTVRSDLDAPRRGRHGVHPDGRRRHEDGRQRQDAPALLVQRVGRLQRRHGVRQRRARRPLPDPRRHDRLGRPYEHGQRPVQPGRPSTSSTSCSRPTCGTRPPRARPTSCSPSTTGSR